MKELWKIVLNRVKLGFTEFLMDVITGTLHEYQRSKRAGSFDVHSRPMQDNSNEDSNYKNQNHA